MNTHTIDYLAKAIVKRIATAGNGQMADRMALREELDTGGEKDLGGWCIAALRHEIADEIRHFFTPQPSYRRVEILVRCKARDGDSDVVRYDAPEDVCHTANHLKTDATHAGRVIAWIPPVPPAPVVDGEVSP